MQTHSMFTSMLVLAAMLAQTLMLRISRNRARPRTMLARPPTKRVADQAYLKKQLTDIKYVISLKLLACHYCKNGGDYNHCSEADTYYNPPRPARHIWIVQHLSDIIIIISCGWRCAFLSLHLSSRSLQPLQCRLHTRPSF
jgi:hypothetical protein